MAKLWMAFVDGSLPLDLHLRRGPRPLSSFIDNCCRWSVGLDFLSAISLATTSLYKTRRNMRDANWSFLRGLWRSKMDIMDDRI